MPDEPLASWNDTPARAAILDFVERVTTAGGPDFVPVAERIATFDDDGTLWCEKPPGFGAGESVFVELPGPPRRPVTAALPHSGDGERRCSW